LLYERFHGLGLEPWDLERDMALSVEVDPALAASATDFACVGPPLDASQNNPCNGWDGQPFLNLAGTLRVTSPNGGVGGWYPWIELTLGADPAAQRARACAHFYTDAIPDQCPMDAVAACAVSGTVTLSAWPIELDTLADLKVAIDVTFANGLALTGTMVAP
jgi:hypothetical protein